MTDVSATLGPRETLLLLAPEVPQSDGRSQQTSSGTVGSHS